MMEVSVAPEFKNIYMKILFFIITAVSIFSCRSTKQIEKVTAPKDSTNVVIIPVDSSEIIAKVVEDISANKINFKTFSAKIKVDAEDENGKQPEIVAQLRMIKDSAIWASISATFLNIEVYRVLITPTKVILLNKQDKIVQYRDLSFLQSVIELPVDFSTLQNILIGNPVFFPGEISAVKKQENMLMIFSAGEFFKQLLIVGEDSKLPLQSKLDDINVFRSRTANFRYGDYETIAGRNFATFRQIMVSEKNKLDLKLKYKQVEFDKDVNVTLNVPKNYSEK